MREVKIDSMDCHAVQAPLAMTEKGKFSATGFFYTTAKDSKICDEKAGLRRLLCGDKTRCLSHKQKASSLLYRAKLNPPARN